MCNMKTFWPAWARTGQNLTFHDVPKTKTVLILNSEMRTTADLRETDCQEADRKGEQSESNYTEHTDKEGLLIEVQVT